MTSPAPLAEAAVAGPVPRYELAEWRERWGIVAGITGRGSGMPFDLGLAGTRAPVGEVLDRWRALRSAVPGFHGAVVSRQIHGTEIRWHGDLTGLVIEEGADGHATATAGVLLAVTAADCVPVYLADPVRRIVALVHAGWRGTAAGIVGRAIELMVARGCLVENMAMHCGIGICGTCYEVGAEVLQACGVGGSDGAKGHLDLREVLLRQARGYSVDKISTSVHCSLHGGDRFFSHRGSGGADGRMVAYLGLPEGSSR